ncbi:MAG: squalene/phytoene synthase family protein [Paracoccus sp. (in: a-proteobacteria)]|uniref:squalene/phytoene synthase family protein n=1 Tax=Paracoccus sp. TaxID=267 RepID=UPI0026DFED51|nr:squalene/phytoene synthase family protein [Paracoccus sp. (in: a-proteobacteria)]MDO5622595.1 squalene/phytoene synthase family protein [Paracoccus sp. (in: a-proteobacteria)]
MSALARLANWLRQADPDRFGASLTAPQALRPKLWALYALNLEAARAPFAAREPMLAEMRLQYWLNQLAALGEGRPADRHDMLDVLRDHWGRDAVALAGLVSAREWDCWPQPFDGADELLAYIDATAGGVMRHAAGVLGARGDEGVIADQARGVGLANWLLAQPVLQGQGRGLRDAGPQARADLARRGLAALDRATNARREVPRKAAPALYGGVARRVLEAIFRDPEAAKLPSDAGRKLKLALFSVTGRW